jgi:uncharacterized protein
MLDLIYKDLVGRIFKWIFVYFDMISREEALELLKTERVEEHVVRHSLLVNKIANYLADELVEMGVNVDIDLVDVGSLLHDVGRGRNHKEHTKFGVEVMEELGEDKIAKIVSLHNVDYFDESLSIEEKLVNYADKRVKHDELVSMDDRMNDIIERYPHVAEIVKKVLPKYKEFEDEVFGVIGEEKRALESLKK